MVQGSLVLGDMSDRKVDTDFSSLNPEFSSKNQAGLSMEVTKPVKLVSRSLVVEVKLVLGIHGVREARHNLVHRTHGRELDNPSHGGFIKERGPKVSCSKEISLIMVV